MSKSLAEYGNQKSTAINTAKRLAEFLGADMVKDKVSYAIQFIQLSVITKRKKRKENFVFEEFMLFYIYCMY